MKGWIAGVGIIAIHLCSEIGERGLLLARSCRHIRIGKRRGLRLRESLLQMARLGIRPVPLIILVNILIGAIIAVSLSPTLRELGVLDWISMITGITQTRELGPLMTALMMSGFAGAAIASEIGTMSVSDELIALEAQALPPAYFLVAPRLVAMLIMMPCLTLIADASGIFGGFCVGTVMLDIAPAMYYESIIGNVTNTDLWRGVLIKAEVFAVIITITACHLGLRARNGAEGVGNATTGAVVQSIILVIAANLVMAIVFNHTLAP